jgi:aminoglycoside phosphotransferase (APT) family kinase protein
VPGPDPDRALIERMLSRPVAEARRAAWGFQNHTDLLTLAGGERVVLQRYRRRQDAVYRLRVMRGLWRPAADAGIAIPLIRDADLDSDPPWVVFDALPGIPVPEAGDVAPGGPHFTALAQSMGELLLAFSRLPADDLELNDLWASPERLPEHARAWLAELPDLSTTEQAGLTGLAEGVPALFAGRPPVLAHGDFAPVNVLVSDSSISGLLDFESVRLADPLFDPAWWAWSVSFSSTEALAEAWPVFLGGAGIDANEPRLSARIESLQTLRMLELLAGGANLDAHVRRVVLNRLRASVRREA